MPHEGLRFPPADNDLVGSRSLTCRGRSVAYGEKYVAGLTFKLVLPIDIDSFYLYRLITIIFSHTPRHEQQFSPPSQVFKIDEIVLSPGINSCYIRRSRLTIQTCSRRDGFPDFE